MKGTNTYKKYPKNIYKMNRKQNDGGALDFYNQAVLLAPSDDSGRGEDLAIALANRAAVLLRQEKFT